MITKCRSDQKAWRPHTLPYLEPRSFGSCSMDDQTGYKGTIISGVRADGLMTWLCSVIMRIQVLSYHRLSQSTR